MPALVDKLQKMDFTVGLWIIPFVVNKGDSLLEEHPEYLVQDEYGRPKMVGGYNCYCLDPTHPKAQKRIRQIFKRIKSWKINFIKLDFLRCLISPDPDDEQDGLFSVRKYYSGATRVEAYREGLKIIRDELGDEVFILGCGGPSIPAIGLIDGHRVGQDISTSWDDGKTGIRDCSKNLALSSFFHNLLWTNDPDYLVAPNDTGLMRFWATAVALSGGMVIGSFEVEALTTWQTRSVSSLIPPYGKSATPLLKQGLLKSPSLWSLPIKTAFGDWKLIGLFNWSEEVVEQEITCELLELNSEKSYYFWSFWRWNELKKRKLTLSPRSAELILVKEKSDRPDLLSTSYHFTQGSLEIADVKWEESDFSLTIFLEKEFLLRSGEIALSVPKEYKIKNIENASILRVEGEVTIIKRKPLKWNWIRVEFNNV